jgi:neutral ceramidase
MRYLKKTSPKLLFLCFIIAICIIINILSFTTLSAAPGNLQIGAAVSDITGPITEISTGYNSPGSIMEGLSMRLFARAFIAASPESGKRIVFVSAEMVHMTESIKPGVLKELNQRGLGSYYNVDNIMLTGTHTHAAPSNISWYTLYNAANGTIGFDSLHYQIVIKGIADSIQKAHNSLKPGQIKIISGDVPNTAYNRSQAAYEQNIDAKNFNSDTNSTMVLLRFEGIDGSEIGELNWFGVHGTSLSINNHLVSGDNKGYASYSFEKQKGNSFVAAFAQSESGDISPNKPNPTDITASFLRPTDEDPILTELDNPVIHGKKQLNAAINLYNNTQVTLGDNIDFRHSFVDFNNISYIDPKYIGEYKMPYDDVSKARTEIACIGGAFLAGDEEGAPVNIAKEGEIRNSFIYQDGTWKRQDYQLSNLQLKGTEKILNNLWPLAKGVLGTDKYSEIQKEKVVLLPVGKVDDFWFPNPQTPFVQTIQPLQVFTIGNFAIVGIPFECTTMEARRIKSTLLSTLKPSGITQIVLSTHANAYSQYLTTREEYAAQNFEGSFDLYGPWSGAAVTQELDRLCQDLVSNKKSTSDSTPPDLSNQQFVQTAISSSGVFNDSGNFGKIVTDVKSSYNNGDTVQVVFEGAHPRNILTLKSKDQLNKFYNPDTFSYLEIQKKNSDDLWDTVCTDRDPYTTFKWKRTGGELSPTSEVSISWLSRNASPGIYRIIYNGLSKSLQNVYSKFTGISNNFSIITKE